MKIYLSAAWYRREEMQQFRVRLQGEGFDVKSRWLDEGAIGLAHSEAAEIDLDDISDCDVFVTFTEDSRSHYFSGGRHVELGFAIGLGLKVYVAGAPENVFHLAPGVERVGDQGTLIEALHARAARLFVSPHADVS